MSKLRIFFLFLSITNIVFAQNSVKLLPYSESDTAVFQELKIPLQIVFKDTAQLNKKLDDLKRKLVRKGYHYSDLEVQNSVVKIFFGDKLKELVLDISEIPEFYRGNAAEIQSKTWAELHKKSEQIAENYIYDGYLNATYYYDTLFYASHSYRLRLRIDTGKKYYLDTLYFEGKDAHFNPDFAKAALRFTPNDATQFKNLLQLEQNIANSPYFELANPMDILIKDSLVKFVVSLKERKTNQFYAFLGILPKSYGSDETTVTGDVRLQLNNLFNRGVSLNLSWQKPQNGNQFLNLSTAVPFLFNSPFGVQFDFGLEKYDTSFVRLNYYVKGLYQPNLFTKVSLFYRYQSSSILKLDTSFALTGKLPSTLDYSYNQFGISYDYNHTDNFFLPRKGWQISTTAAFGFKDTKVNSQIANKTTPNGESYQKLYDSIGLNHATVSVQAQASHFLPLGRNLVLKTVAMGKVLFSQNISLNEMYNFGGIKYPRGFDDYFFWSPCMGVLSGELQYFLTDYFQTNIFADGGAMQNINEKQFQLGYPIGWGVGLSFRSGGSQFNVSLAYGKYLDNPINWSNPKVHIGYVAIF